MPEIYVNQPKIEVHHSYEKDEKVTTNIEAINNEDAKNKGFLNKTLYEIEGGLSFLEEDFNEFKILTNKQSIEEVLIKRAVKTNKHILNH